MAGTPIVYVICDSNCRFESMTKEQILTAIMQAVESGTITDVDAGFVTRLKTVNNKYIKFFIGTQAEYNALTAEQKSDGLFAIITNDTVKTDIYETLRTLSQSVKEISEGLQKKSYDANNAKTADKAAKAAADNYGNEFITRYLRVNGRSEDETQGDPTAGITIHCDPAAPSWYHFTWESNNTIYDFGVIRWDGKKTLYSPVSIIRSISGGLQHFAVKIELIGDMGVWIEGTAKIVMFNNETGAEAECAVSGTTLFVQHLTDVPQSE